MEKINFRNNNTPALNATNLNKLQDNIEDALLDFTHPVNSLYISTDSTSPEILFGGTWEQIKDVFLLGAGDIYKAGTTGGESEHMLTIDEMPSHRHKLDCTVTTGSSGYETLRADTKVWSSSFSDYMTSYVGGGQAHNNMPPYLTVYMWKRIA